MVPPLPLRVHHCPWVYTTHLPQGVQAIWGTLIPAASISAAPVGNGAGSQHIGENDSLGADPMSPLHLAVDD